MCVRCGFFFSVDAALSCCRVRSSPESLWEAMGICHSLAHCCIVHLTWADIIYYCCCWCCGCRRSRGQSVGRKGRESAVAKAAEVLPLLLLPDAAFGRVIPAVQIAPANKINNKTFSMNKARMCSAGARCKFGRARVHPMSVSFSPVEREM